MFNCLIVDDSSTLRAYLQEILEGYAQCVVADCGQHALKICEAAFRKTENFDLILMDIMMPEMDGFQTLEKIHELQDTYKIDLANRSKVIMLSSLDDPENMMRAHFEFHVDVYLTKPLEQEILYEALANIELISEQKISEL